MKLYLISQDVNHDFDTFDSAVVIAQNEDKAREIMRFDDENSDLGCWVKESQKSLISVKYLGESCEQEACVVLSSFNAG